MSKEQLDKARASRTPESHQEATKTFEDRYGKDFWSKMGTKGGKAKNPRKGFGSNPALAREMGKRRGKNFKSTSQSKGMVDI